MKNKTGFTLFELLVSISIIAVMTAVAVVSFGGINRRARDAKRIADLEKIRLALEAYKQENNVYPSGLTVLVGSSLLQQVPLDPKSGIGYSYGVGSSYVYQICASVEDLGSTSTSTTGCGITTVSGAVGFYKLVNP